MELGLCSVCLLDRSWEQALDTLARHKIHWVEANAGGHIPKDHFDPLELLADDEALARFADSLSQHDIRIAAFGCYGNPVHPTEWRRRRDHDDFVATCKLAERLGVTRVSVISGCPAGGPNDRAPNWIINSIYPDFRKAYDWQWEKSLIPYWREAARTAEDHGVQICIEPHGGDMVYNLETFERLRDAVGATIGATFDPSHLWWMGIDVLSMIRELAGAIYYVHAKDVQVDSGIVTRQGLVPAVDYADWNRRSWVYRAIGQGHDEQFWRAFVTTLRRTGYDDVVSIEIEDPFLTIDDAIDMSVATLRAALPRNAPPAADWFDNYNWEAADVE
jgi:sugar phosphate isomerase/epimerase